MDDIRFYISIDHDFTSEDQYAGGTVNRRVMADVMIRGPKVRKFVNKVAKDIVKENKKYAYWVAEAGRDSRRATAYILDYHPVGMLLNKRRAMLKRALTKKKIGNIMGKAGK